jgi:hypothetical protein
MTNGYAQSAFAGGVADKWGNRYEARWTIWRGVLPVLRGEFDADPQSRPGPDLVVEHEIAELTYRDGVYETRIRRQLRNTGAQPVTQYLMRIAVDRYPGDPERSNRLYREDPLTWEEIGLSASCGDETMAWHVKHDRDAFKEVWLLFENADGRFPLYPGETTWISYVYTVSAHKWGPWWQRAIRLPTKRLSMTAVFPARLQPAVWGITTSMTAEASPFPTPICRQQKDDQVVFTWSVEEPPLHARTGSSGSSGCPRWTR